MKHFIVWITIFFILGCVLDQTHENQEPIATVNYDGSWGFIDTLGNAIVSGYDDVENYAEGFAAVRTGNDWGYIDLNGNVLVEPVFRAAYPFSDGLAMVSDSTNRYGFINTSGALIIPIIYDKATSCSEGLIGVCQNGSCGYLDITGEKKLAFKYTDVTAFKNGHAVVKSPRSGLIDSNGKMVLPMEFDKIGDLRENRVRARKDGQWRFYDLNGTQLFSNSWELATDFHYGVAAVGNEQMHLIDAGGNRLGENTFDRIKYAQNNRWYGEKERKYYLISASGEKVSDDFYYAIYPFSEGRAAIKSEDNYWVYIDTSAQINCQIGVPLPWSFKEGYCRILSGGRFGFVNADCEPVIEPTFTDAGDFSNYRAKVKFR